MNTYILFHHLLMLLFFLVLPRLPAIPTSDSGMLEVLVLGRVGYIPAKGLYTCFTRMGGAVPDLTLQYSATYTYGPSKTLATCNGDLNQDASILDGSIVYCLPPCPGMGIIDPASISVVITGHNRVTRDIQAALMESFNLSNVIPTVIQPGEGVLEVQWAAKPGKTYRVQLWHYPQSSVKSAGPTVEVEVMGMVETKTGEIEKGDIGRVECKSEAVQSAGGLLKDCDEKVEDNQGAFIDAPMEKEKVGQYEEMKEHDLFVTKNKDNIEVMENGNLLNKGIIEGNRESSEKAEGENLEDTEITLMCGVMSNETLIKVKQCYHDFDKDDDADDDDDDNDNDDDNEEDNDDFIKFMRWRKCVALYAPCTTITAASSSVVLNTSGPLNCPTEQCVYYFMNIPTSGSLSVEVMDVTDAVVSSYHTPPTPIQEWNSLIIDTILLSTEGVDVNPTSKTMIIKLSDTLQEDKQGSRETGKVEDEGEMAVEVERMKGDYQALIINDHNHSDAIMNLPAKCDPLRSVCSVKHLQTLVDPEEQGPVSAMFLLLSNHYSGSSSLVSLIDVHIRVHKVAPGTAVVMWDREPGIKEFIVHVVHDNGESSETITVICSKRGTDCLATFKSLAKGHYRAEVSYTKKVKVLSSCQFFMEDDSITE